MASEKINSKSISTDFHSPKLIKLPGVQIRGPNRRDIRVRVGSVTMKRAPNETYVYAHVAMHAGTVQTKINPKSNAGPSWIAAFAIEAELQKTMRSHWYLIPMHPPCWVSAPSEF